MSGTSNGPEFQAAPLITGAAGASAWQNGSQPSVASAS
jgi:hypothetical protein